MYGLWMDAWIPCCLSVPFWKTILTMNYFKQLFSQFKDILYILTNWACFRVCSRLTVISRDPDGSRVKEWLNLHAQSFPSTGMSEVIHETLAHLQMSAQTSMKSQFELVSHFLLLNLARYICFPLWKWLKKVESSGFRFNSQCHMMPSRVWGLRGGVYVCVCVCVCVSITGLCFGVERGKGICVFVRTSSWRTLTTERCAVMNVSLGERGRGNYWCFWHSQRYL